ncbi:ATPase, T2SS/T4P/T4SS family [Aeromonas sp. MdU4]|uniref:ATPase, T2SS/T4P/T4SS family n=1 Tax=Aeromonas sp. MdU4 TaxID=3342819 RepID=UPI0035B91072
MSFFDRFTRNSAPKRLVATPEVARATKAAPSLDKVAPEQQFDMAHRATLPSRPLSQVKSVLQESPSQVVLPRQQQPVKRAEPREDSPAPVVSGLLEELNFSDLMIWPDGRGFLRHVVGYRGPIISVPEAYKHDVQRVLDEINGEARGREFFLRHDGVPYRVARIETIDGPGYFLRRPKYPIPHINSLGLPAVMAETLHALGNSSGMILIAGATGSGKSTTMYSLLNQLVAERGDIAVAVEDPPEVPAQGIYGERGQGLWYQIDANKVGGFEVAMVAAMRYNPRYIMLGEIREPKVANEAIRAAVNGHLVLATIHGNSLAGAIMALQQIAAAGAGSQDLARSILADGLSAVVHQELIADPERPGQRNLQANMLCFGKDMGLRAKIRSGKLELLSTEIEAQRLCIMRGQHPIDLS